jgi:hypothetical protein
VVSRRLRPESELCLLLAGTAGSRSSRAGEARELIGRINWSVLQRVLFELGVLPVVGQRALDLADTQAPADFREAVVRAQDACADQSATLELLTIQLLTALRAADIKALSLKGPLLGRAVYGQAGLRPSGDIDILVAKEELPAAVAAATDLGYVAGPEPVRMESLPLLHVRLLHRQAWVPPLELHWRVAWAESQFSRDMLHRSEETGEFGNRAQPPDEFVSLLLYYARDGFVGIRLACDLAAWWDRYGDRLADGAISDMIVRYPALERALKASLRAAEEIVGVPSSSLLRDPGEAERRVALAVRLANPHAAGTVIQQHADAWLIDWLLTPPGGRLECIRRQLYAPALMDHDLHPERHFEGLAPFTRGLRLSRRFATSLTRVGWEQLRDVVSTRHAPIGPGRAA